MSSADSASAPSARGCATLRRRQAAAMARRASPRGKPTAATAMGVYGRRCRADARAVTRRISLRAIAQKTTRRYDAMEKVGCPGVREGDKQDKQLRKGAKGAAQKPSCQMCWHPENAVLQHAHQLLAALRVKESARCAAPRWRCRCARLPLQAAHATRARKGEGRGLVHPRTAEFRANSSISWGNEDTASRKQEPVGWPNRIGSCGASPHDARRRRRAARHGVRVAARPPRLRADNSDAAG